MQYKAFTHCQIFVWQEGSPMQHQKKLLPDKTNGRVCADFAEHWMAMQLGVQGVNGKDLQAVPIVLKP